jgi:predicted ATPase/DNA-binding SARP family transcriptional activator
MKCNSRQRKPFPRSLDIHLLGPCRIKVGGEPVEMRRKARLLVELLALQKQHRLHHERIVDLLWPDQELESATNNLYKTIHAARRALEPGLISGNDSCYILTRDRQVILSSPRSLWIDIEIFEKLAAEAVRQTDIAPYEAALRHYGGDLLAEDPYLEWATERRETLRATQQHLLLKLAEYYQEQGQHERSVDIYQGLIASDPLNEDAHRRLMLSYALLGDRRQATRQYQQCRAVLRAELAVEPESATRELSERIGSGKVQPLKQCGARPEQQPPASSARLPAATNLPHAATSFVGRTKEVGDVKRLLGGARLTTLVGPGGIGKTRLATEVAAQVVDDFADGVWLIELAPLTNQALVPQAVAAVFGLREGAAQELPEMLCGSLRTKHTLLILDNCEHVIGVAAALVDRLLRACEHVRVLATSREALGVAGEALWHVSTLSCPEATAKVPTSRATGYESVQLFLERAGLSNPGWRLSEGNVNAVTTLCRRLEGIPLAIELAAARMKVLSVEEIIRRLNDRFRLLTGGGRTTTPRHQTLRATIDWSYSLLPPEEQALWRRLSVFAGGWTLKAAEVICAGGGIERDAVFDLLSRLVDKSLVIVNHEGVNTRYSFLETIRQYGAEMLRAGREGARVRGRHCAWHLRLAERAAGQFAGARQRFWFDRLEAEHDNLRAALQWSIHETQEAGAGLRLCNALWRFWQARGHSGEGRGWLRAALSLDSHTPSLRAKAFHGASALASMQGDFEDARVLLERGLALSREIDDRQGVAHELQRLGIIAYYTGDYLRAATLQQESLVLCQELGDAHGLARAVGGLGILALDQGDYEQARLRFEECIGIYRREGHQLGIMGTLNNLGETAYRQGDYDRAEQLLKQSLAMAQELGDKGWIARSTHVLGHVAIDRGHYQQALQFFQKALTILQESGDAVVVHVLEGLACTAAAQGQVGRAVCLAEATDRLRRATSMCRTPAEQANLDRHLSKTKQASGKAEIACAHNLGRTMTLDQAVAYALGFK